MDISELPEEFDFVDTLTLERNKAGEVDLKMPQPRYNKSDQTPLHEYGWGPFCNFYADTSDYKDVPGVYIFTANHEVVYIGETVDLHRRIQADYSNISPRNCFKGGQETNCRINKAILEVVRNGGQVGLWFTETESHGQKEAELIDDHDPSWNEQPPTTYPTEQTTTVGSNPKGQRDTTKSTSIQQPTQDTSTSNLEYARHGKYGPLYDYLEETEEHTLHFAFEEIEEILEAPLPNSAYEHEVWWNPAGHTHATGWADLGWSADPNLDSQTVVFSIVK